MTRHSKNCTSNPVYTYHEARKDIKTGSYGTISQRCGKEAIKDFDCCCLSLQPCLDPVVTPQGFLFDKAAILELKVQWAEYNKYRAEVEKHSEENQDKERKKCKFMKMENDILQINKSIQQPYAPLSSQHIKVNAPGDKTDKEDKKLASFWVPTLTPDAKEKENKDSESPLFSHMYPPPTQVLCPFSNKPLKMKELIPVRFKKISKGGPTLEKLKNLQEGRSTSSFVPYSANSANYHYVCAVTGDIINNNVPCAILRISGCVVTMECVAKLISKDMVDPINGKPLKRPNKPPTPEQIKANPACISPDIIPLQRGGTGFVGAVPGDLLLLKPTHKTPALHM